MSDLPPFTVEPVLGRVFGDELAIRACSVAAPGQAYLAASDGSLKIYDVSVYPPIEHEHMPLPAFSTSALPNANPTKPKSVNKLSVIPHINRVLVQAENVLSFYALPAFNPVSGGAAVGGALGSGASAVKGVLAYDVDYASAKSDSIELIILKKKGAALFNLTSHGVELLREVALPNPIVTAIALKNWCLCYSDLEAYSIMDLHTSQHMKHLLPISQDPPSDEPQPPNPNQRPSIIAVGTEYLLCSHSGSSTLGVFVSADSGEPSRGTMQWSSNVRSLALQHDLVMALLLNETIQIHRHCDQRHIFTLELPESVTEPRSLIPCPSGPLSLPVSQIALDPIIKASVQLYPSDKSEDEPPTTPGVTPDATSFPKQSVQHISSALSSARIDTLLLSRTGLSSIHPQPLVQIAERHLSQKKTQEAQIVASAPYCPNELKAYIHLRLGLEYLYQTNFDEAGPCFVMACAFGTDPRLLIRLFPDLRLSHWSRSDSSTHAWTFAGAVEQLIKFSSIDALILANLMHNYSPHLDPQHDSENLIASLQTSSRQMIRLVCESYRAQNTWPRGEPEIKTAVLTALAKLEAEEGADEDYLARISEGASATDIEEWLEDRHSLHLLASLHSQTRNERKLLEIWSRIVDEQLEPLPPLQDILDTAKRQKDEGLRMHYAFWLVERETAIGLRALWDEPSLDSDAKRLSVYEQLQDRKSELAFEYLDGLVLESDHQETLEIWLDNALGRLAKSSEETSDFQTAANMSVPDRLLLPSNKKSAILRLRMIALLSTHQDLDWTKLRTQLERAPSLSFERSLVYGQMGLWRQALSTLVISANDVVSAECFCIQRGVPLNSFTLRRILDRLGVDVEQVNLNTPGSLAPPTSELLQLLIDILLNSQQPNSTPALTRFINAQSSHLEPLVVLDRIPEDVPLAGLAPFFVRALRRSNHKAFNTNVYKTLAASQTTAVGSQLYEMQRHVKPHIQNDVMPAPSEIVHSPKTSEVIDLTAKLAFQEDIEGSLEPKLDSL